MKRKFHNELYLGLPLANFLPETELQCNVFIYLPVNEKMVKIYQAGQTLSKTRLQSYKAKKFDELYILDPFDNSTAYEFKGPKGQNPLLPPAYSNTEKVEHEKSFVVKGRKEEISNGLNLILNPYSNKLKESEAKRESSKLPISQEAINLTAHAVTYAIGSGYRKKSSLRNLAMVALAEFASNEFDSSVLPDEIQKIRLKILNADSKSSLWFRDMKNAIELSRALSQANPSIPKFFAPEKNLFNSSYNTLESQSVVDQQFLRQAQTYLNSPKSKPLKSLPIEVTVFATNAVNVWINGESAALQAKFIKNANAGPLS